jgi:hypothetical protein
LLHGKGELRAEDVGQHVRTLGHVFNTSFPKALENAAVFFDYHHEHPVGTSWGIHCALICLIRYFPDCVDKLIDSLVPIGQNSQGVLSGLAAALTVAVRNLDEDSQMLAFVQSRSTFMRALAGVAKWRTVQNGSADWNDFKSHLERYNLSERQEFLSRALFDLRIKANQAKGRGLELDQPLLPKVFDAILSGFADGASIERMLELMPNYSGPINGSWAASTHNEILRELVRRGVLAGDAPFRIWQEILWEKCEKNFYADTDLELIQVWGATYWDATEGLQCAVLQDANKLLLRAEKTLYDPFLHSRNYDRWRAAADIVLWWMIRLWAIIQKRPPAREPSDLESIVQFVTRLVDGEELVQSAIGELQHYSSIVLEKLRSPDTVA